MMPFEYDEDGIYSLEDD
jgi:predicted RNA-binding Zn-ribbon protein involved in translation (DUF1610 family)